MSDYQLIKKKTFEKFQRVLDLELIYPGSRYVLPLTPLVDISDSPR